MDGTHVHVVASVLVLSVVHVCLPVVAPLIFVMMIVKIHQSHTFIIHHVCTLYVRLVFISANVPLHVDCHFCSG